MVKKRYIVGTGPEKILVLHNWFSDSRSYEPMIPYLNQKLYTYVFLDLRGYGLSKEITGNYSVEEASADVLTAVNGLGWNAFHLIGHSMSGMIAQKFAVDNPARVKSIIAITPVPASGSPKPAQVMQFLQEAAGNNRENACACVHILTGSRYSQGFAEKMVDDWWSCSTPSARVGYLDMFSNTDFSASVKGLQTPMLVIFGENDMEGEEALMRETFLTWYPNAELVCCKCAGHFPSQETPVALAGMIEAFF